MRLVSAALVKRVPITKVGLVTSLLVGFVCCSQVSGRAALSDARQRHSVSPQPDISCISSLRLEFAVDISYRRFVVFLPNDLHVNHLPSGPSAHIQSPMALLERQWVKVQEKTFTKWYGNSFCDWARLC
jgi:hypothetical protein